MPFGRKKIDMLSLGEGKIGLEAIVNFMTHPKLKDLPFFLETPFDEEGHKREDKNDKEKY